MIIFATPGYFKRFVGSIRELDPDVIVGNCEVARYPSGEMHVYIHNDVMDEDCLVISSIAPPDENLVALLMMTDTLKRRGARSVQIFLPYLGYSRQDKFEPGESSGIAIIGSLLRTSGADKIITVDAHSKLDQELIGLPLVSIPSSSLFISEIKGLDWNDITIVAPDEGAIVRAQAVADTLKVTRPVVYLVKKHDDGIVHLNLIGEVGDRVIIIDDIIDGGRTVVSACNVLRRKGVKEIAVAVTHGLFNSNAMDQMSKLDLKALLVSDSCPEPEGNHSGTTIVSIERILPLILSEIIGGRVK